jgi:serine/threonine protein phosphatase 1
MYIISDVHGNYKTLKKLMEKLNTKNVCFVGDIINKGKNSKKVISYIRRYKLPSVLGNHEIKIIDFVEKHPFISLKKLKSLSKREKIFNFINEYNSKTELKKDIAFLKTFPVYKIYKNIKINNKELLVTHSYGNDKIKLLTSRKTYRNKERIIKQITENRDVPEDKKERFFNVYGHTPKTNKTFNDYNINIDFGINNMGVLTAYNTCNQELIQVFNID